LKLYSCHYNFRTCINAHLRLYSPTKNSPRLSV